MPGYRCDRPGSRGRADPTFPPVHRGQCSGCLVTMMSAAGLRAWSRFAAGGRGGTIWHRAPVAQWIERLPPEQEATGSSPVGRTTPPKNFAPTREIFALSPRIDPPLLSN